MPKWLIIQLAIGLLWFIIWSIIGVFRSQKVGFLFDKKDIFKLVYYIALPISYFLTIVFVEVIFLFKFGLDSFGVNHTIIPFTLIAILFLVYRYYQMQKKDEKKTEQAIYYKRQECLEWFRNFSFVDENKVQIQIYDTKNSIVGKAIISNVTDEEAMELKASKDSFPENISLLILKKKISGYQLNLS
ncbi:hypothetical protein LS996_22970 [Bacillus cereus]|uniref:hypothetical protein n=1 Tax=Bacillus cereus group TaxID=86661 RepID=UPI001F57E528